MTQGRRPIPVPLPLAVWERDGLAAALAKAGLPTDHLQSTDTLYWRFENDFTPLGYGGLDILGDQALLHSVVTLPPVRNSGIGSAIMAFMENEARIRGCRVAWVVTGKAAEEFFLGLGYLRGESADAPAAIRDAKAFAAATWIAMTKRLD